MSDREVERVSLQIFEDEHPELFQRLRDMPKNRVRRRTAILKLLEAGMQVEQGAVVLPVASAAAAPRAPSAQPAPVASPAREPQEPSMRNEHIPAEDLGELFPT